MAEPEGRSGSWHAPDVKNARCFPEGSSPRPPSYEPRSVNIHVFCAATVSQLISSVWKQQKSRFKLMREKQTEPLLKRISVFTQTRARLWYSVKVAKKQQKNPTEIYIYTYYYYYF